MDFKKDAIRQNKKLELTLNRFVVLLVLSIFILPVLSAPVSTCQIKPNITLFTFAEQPLAKALTKLSHCTEYTILAPAKLVTGVKSTAVYGHYSLEKALRIMLYNTGLSAKFTTKNSIVIQAQKKTHHPQQAISSSHSNDPVFTPPTMEEISITGKKSVLHSQVFSKKQSINFTEHLYNSTLTQLPDITLANSLVRISGLTVSRDSGEGRQVFLRGLPANFTQTRINGLEVLFTTDTAIDQRGGAMRSRSFDFNLFDGDLFNQVIVQKSYRANIDEGGIAGTIDLVSKRPFDYHDNSWHGAFSAQAQHNQATQNTTPALSALLSKNWHTVGALFSLTYNDIDTIEHGFHSWQWRQANVAANNLSTLIPKNTREQLSGTTAEQRVFFPIGNSLSSWGNKRKRLALATSFQWEISANHLLNIDAFTGQLRNKRTHYQLATAGENGLIGDINGTQLLTNATIKNNGLVYADFERLDLRSEHQKQHTQTNFHQVSVQWLAQLSDKLELNVLAGYSNSAFSAPINRKLFLQAQNKQVSIDWRNNQELVTQYNFDLTSPKHWQLMRSDIREDAYHNNFNTLKADFSYQFNDGQSIEFGVQTKQYNSNGWERRHRVDWLTKVAQPHTYFTLTEEPITQSYTIAQHQPTFEAIWATNLQPKHLSETDNRVGTVYRVEENTRAAYFLYNHKSLWLNWAVEHSLGLRWFSSEQYSLGAITQLKQIKVKQHYAGWLPSLNTTLALNPQWLLRSSLSRNITRPDVNQLRTNADINVADLEIKLGNPNLKPFSANAFDLGIEFYGVMANASMTLFYKNFSDYIIENTDTKSYRDTGLPLHFLTQDIRRTPDSEFTVYQPDNANSAIIYGIEWALQTALPQPFEQFSLTANININGGETHLIKNKQSIKTDPIGLSTWSYHSMLSYQYGQGNISISATYRDRYISRVGQAQNTIEGFNEHLVIDFNMWHQLAENIELTVSATNLTDQPLRQFQDHRPLVSVRSGRQFSLGSRWSF